VFLNYDDGGVGRLGQQLQPALADGVLLREALDEDDADELSVSHSFGFAEDDLEIGILLIECEEFRDGGFVLYKALKGVTTACEGEECNVGVPLVKDVGHHLGGKKESAHLIGGADILDGTIFETGDVIDYFCHIQVFSAKIIGASAKIWQKLSGANIPTPVGV
jgi:hypothetical protein